MYNVGSGRSLQFLVCLMFIPLSVEWSVYRTFSFFPSAWALPWLSSGACVAGTQAWEWSPSDNLVCSLSLSFSLKTAKPPLSVPADIHFSRYWIFAPTWQMKFSTPPVTQSTSMIEGALLWIPRLSMNYRIFNAVICLGDHEHSAPKGCSLFLKIHHTLSLSLSSSLSLIWSPLWLK